MAALTKKIRNIAMAVLTVILLLPGSFIFILWAIGKVGVWLLGGE